MLIKDAVYVYRLIGGSKLALHGRRHSHENGYEIHLFLEGSGAFLLNQSKYAFEGNRLFWAAPGERHSILPEAIKSPVSYYAVLFEPELPADFEAVALLDRSGRRHFATEPQERFLMQELLCLRGRQIGRAAEHLLLSLLHRWLGKAPAAQAPEAPAGSSAAAAAPAGSAGSGAGGKALPAGISSGGAGGGLANDGAAGDGAIGKAPPAGLIVDGAAKSGHVGQALALMERSVKEKLSTDALSEKLGISKEHFIRVFRGQTGIPPLQYFTRLKVEAAGAFLADSSLRIGAVAEYFGFDSPFHFSKVFKKSTGLSPKEYRKTFRRP